MKQVLMTLSLSLFSLGLTVSAQETQSASKEQRRELRKELKKEANISNEQGQKLKSINKDYKEKADAIKNNSALTQEQKKEQLTALQKERKQDLSNVLTPEQRKKIKSFREKHPEMKKQDRHKKVKKQTS